jgi:hypothetical protein
VIGRNDLKFLPPVPVEVPPPTHNDLKTLPPPPPNPLPDPDQHQRGGSLENAAAQGREACGAEWWADHGAAKLGAGARRLIEGR